MSTTARNDPCPCGSGKKYKKCCGAVNILAPDFSYNRIRRMDEAAGNLLMGFAKRRYGDDSLEKAWQAFRFYDKSRFNLSHPEIDFFLRWFTFDWRPQGEDSLAELFLSENGPKLDSELRRFIKTTIGAPYSFFQVLESDPGVGFLLRDVMRKREFQVKERSASSVLARGRILFARTIEMDGMFFLMGNGAHAIPGTYLSLLVDLRAFLEKKGPAADSSVNSETLLDNEDELREKYFQVADHLENRATDIRNTDGEPMAFHTLTYDIPSLDEAFQALKDLEQKMTDVSDAELLARAERDDEGEPTKVILHWLKPPKGGSGEGATPLASLTINTSTLVVEVNSEKRSKRIQKEIKKRLGTDAVLLQTEIKTQKALMKDAADRKKNAVPNAESEHDRLMRESPEVKALVKDMMERHWATWPDVPVPALRGMTPRQAAKNPDGRELLESLLMDFELLNSSQKNEHQRVDLAKLRRDLGMEDG